MNLNNYDQMDIYDLGSHTKETHVNTNPEELKYRLIRGDIDGDCMFTERRKVASMFLSEKIAIAAIKKTIYKNESIIRTWISNRDTDRIMIRTNFLNKIGIGLAKGTDFNNVYPFFGCIVILRLGYNGNEFEILTAYPALTKEINERIQQDRISFHKEHRNNRKM